MLIGKKTKEIKIVRAFSFVEVMVAVFLVSVGLLASLKLLTNGLRESMGSRDQLVASLLAQEGAELVRNIRDSNWNMNIDSFTGIGNGSHSLDYLGQKNGERMKFNSNSGFYENTNGTNTKFYRRINIAGNTDQKIIDSIVIWGGTAFPSDLEKDCNTANKCVYAENTLTRWGE